MFQTLTSSTSLLDSDGWPIWGFAWFVSNSHELHIPFRPRKGYFYGPTRSLQWHFESREFSWEFSPEQQKLRATLAQMRRARSTTPQLFSFSHRSGERHEAI